MSKNAFTVSVVGVFLITFLAMAPAQNIINTLAGGGPNNLPALSASIGAPWAVAQHGGVTYISDNLSNRIFQVDSKGVLTVLAGNIVPNYNGDNHLGTVASIDSPEGIALDAAGNVYIADTSNNVIRVINTQSAPISFYGGALTVQPLNIQTLVGTGQAGYSGPGLAVAVNAELNQPGGIWLDEAGNIYIADTLNSVIEVVNMQTTAQTLGGVANIPAGDLATIAGTNVAMFGGDGGPALAASVNRPAGIFVDSAGNVYIADTLDSRIRVINAQASSSIIVAGVTIPAGDINTVAGSATACALSTDLCGDGGPATSANLNQPAGVLADSSGNIYIADTNDNKIRLVVSAGTISTIAGTGTQCVFATIPCGDGGPATSAELWAPTGVILDTNGNVLIADQNDDAIRNIVGGNIQTTVGAVLNTAYSGDKSATVIGTATDAELRRPAGVASDANGNVFIADTYNSAIREVKDGIITTVVGNGFSCFAVPCGDGGPAASAQLSFPFDVTFDLAGNMYIADSFDEVIRVVNNQSTPLAVGGVTVQPGDILTVAGNGSACSSAPSCGDGGAATSAQLNLPNGVFVDSTGNIFIADTDDNEVRVVNTHTTNVTVAGVVIAGGNIATVAGNGIACPLSTSACGGGAAAIAANLNAPGGVSVDGAGNIYISDTGDNRVRIVNTTGTINIFAGTGAACQNSCGDGGPANVALLDAPQSTFIDHAGNVFIADAADFAIREVTPNGKIQTVAGTNRGYLGDGGPATSAELALPYGVAGDPFGNLLISDVQEWRVRTVAGLVITAPLTSLSPSSVTFPAQQLNTKSAPIPVTLSNVGNGTNLTVSSIVISGTNAADFEQTNNCTSVPGPGSCTINVTITPSATGARNAVLMITDNAAGSPQSINLAGMGTSPSAELSPGSVTFSAQAVNTKSAPIPVTLSNTGAGTTLTATVAITGADKGDFSQTNNCASVPGPGSCTINVTMTPSATGARNAALTVTDNAAGSPQSITLSGTGEDFTLPSTGALSTPTISAGASATATVTITPSAGLAATVALTCAVTPATAVPPTCSLSPSSLTPGNTTSTLTVSTKAATSAALRAPGSDHRSSPLYAVWLLLPGMLLSTAGMGASRRRKLLSYFLLFCAIVGCLFLVACGGGSSGTTGPGGGGAAGTTSGAYNVTVTAKTSTTTMQQTFPLSVQ
ncbi:MAG TPA: choice-of-anchor D domain-containing protein [Terriglobales bacterium]|nr:choice-of-anchor D domain-containing protein [Terriglobales bacterium]